MVAATIAAVCYTNTTSRSDCGRYSLASERGSRSVSCVKLLQSHGTHDFRWRGLFDSVHSLNHVLAVSLYRVETLEAPSPLRLLSTGSDSIPVPRLSETGVRAFADACLHSRIDNVSVLTSFLATETAGNPLFLRTLLSTLVSS